MPLKNSNVAPATLRFSQILENITAQGGTSVVVSGAQSALTREIAIAKVITTSNITLSGEQTIDSISVVQGDTVLVNNQTSEVNNGLYGVRTGAWVRITDPPVISGLPVIVNQGTTADTLWIQMRDFTSYNEGTTNLKWVQVGTGVTYTVSDTNTIDMVMTGTVISANVRYQDSNSIDFSDDAGGLRADVKLATPTVGGNISIESTGLRFNHKLTAGRGINLLNNLPATGDLQILNNVASGVGVKVLEDTPSAGVLTVNHDMNGTEGITLTDNSPSTGDLNIKVTDGGISTAKLADDAVTNAKMANASVGANELIIANQDGYIVLTSGVGTPTEQNINFADNGLRNNYRLYTLSTGGTTSGTVKTFRIPPVATPDEYLPPGIYHIDVYGEITAVAFPGPRTVRHVQAPVLSVAVSGGGARNLAKGATHADPVSGVHIFVNTSLGGGCLIDLTTTTMTDRYFEITFDMTITDSTGAATHASVSSGTCDIFRLTAPSEEIVHET